MAHDETELDKAATLANAIVLHSAQNIRTNSVCASSLFFSFHISSFIPFVRIRGILVRDLRRRRSGEDEALIGVYCLASKNSSLIPALFLFVVLLFTESPSLHLQHVTHVLAKQLSIAEVSTKIATAVDEFLEANIRHSFCDNSSLPSTPRCSASSWPIPTRRMGSARRCVGTITTLSAISCRFPTVFTHYDRHWWPLADWTRM